MPEEIKLYQCRACGAVSSGTAMGGCPTCGHAEGPEVERACLDGGTETVRKSWHKTILVEGRRV